MAYEVTLPPKPHRGRLREEEEEAYVESLTDEQKTLYEQKKNESQVGRRPGRPRKSDTLDADVTISEVQSTAHDIFDALSIAFQSEAEWTEDEFHSIAKGLIVIINRIPILRVVFRFLRPISSVVQILRKVKKLMDGRKPKQQKQNQAA